jgi:hypothetical protein
VRSLCLRGNNWKTKLENLRVQEQQGQESHALRAGSSFAYEPFDEPGRLSQRFWFLDLALSRAKWNSIYSGKGKFNLILKPRNHDILAIASATVGWLGHRELKKSPVLLQESCNR